LGASGDVEDTKDAKDAKDAKDDGVAFGDAVNAAVAFAVGTKASGNTIWIDWRCVVVLLETRSRHLEL
jgi:hypothetical protein